MTQAEEREFNAQWQRNSLQILLSFEAISKKNYVQFPSWWYLSHHMLVVKI
jgi:hypothetical protein